MFSLWELKCFYVGDVAVQGASDHSKEGDLIWIVGGHLTIGGMWHFSLRVNSPYNDR